MEIIFGEETSIAITTLLLYTGFTPGVLFIFYGKVYAKEGFFCIYEKWKSIRTCAKSIPPR